MSKTARKDSGTGIIEPSLPLNQTDWIHFSPDRSFERIEAFFTGHGYKPHRHDTYAIGRTLSGVQSFHYRGSLQNSLPGQIMVLYPDELHDGQAGTDKGFHYQMIYIEPATFQKILNGRPLPYIEKGLSDNPYLASAVNNFFKDMDYKMESLQYDDALYDLTHALDQVANKSKQSKQSKRLIDYYSLKKVHTYLTDTVPNSVTLQELEQIAGYNRWQLSRDFRLVFGTSPHRYLILRRLDLVKKSIFLGKSLAQAALDAYFADQSHMTRHFTRTFGITPSQWQKYYNYNR